MIIHTMEQRSPEWYEIKLGKYSGSMFTKLLMGKSTAGYNDAIDNIVYERITGKRIASFINSDMQYGIDNEPIAKYDYSMRFFRKVVEVGFIEQNEWVGISPDGLVGKDGMIEIKCPKYNTQLKLLRDRKINSDYIIQMQGQMMVSGRKWVDFWSWRDDMKPFYERVYRDEDLILKLKTEIDIAIEEAKERIIKYNKN